MLEKSFVVFVELSIEQVVSFRDAQLIPRTRVFDQDGENPAGPSRTRSQSAPYLGIASVAREETCLALEEPGAGVPSASGDSTSELDNEFRRIAWLAVISPLLSLVLAGVLLFLAFYTSRLLETGESPEWRSFSPWMRTWRLPASTDPAAVSFALLGVDLTLFLATALSQPVAGQMSTGLRARARVIDDLTWAMCGATSVACWMLASAIPRGSSAAVDWSITVGTAILTAVLFAVSGPNHQRLRRSLQQSSQRQDRMDDLVDELGGDVPATGWRQVVHTVPWTWAVVWPVAASLVVGGNCGSRE